MSTNDGGHVCSLYIGPSEDEMVALDALGPLTRRALCDAPVRYSAVPILLQIREFEEGQRARFPEHVRDRFRIDPAEPIFDQMVADGLREDARQLLLRDRSEYDAQLGLKPLRAKVTVKSIREQRRSARRVRW